MPEPINLDDHRPHPLSGISRRDQEAIEAAFMVAVYQARRLARLQELGRAPVPPMTEEGRRLLEERVGSRAGRN